MTIELSADQLEQQQRVLQIHQAYIDVFTSESGKIVLKDLEDQCGIHQIRISLDPNQVMFDQGSQYWYKRIMFLLARSPHEMSQRWPKEPGVIVND
jgi:hypothetical protein